MKLMGRYASPYTRRVGVSMHLLGIKFDHESVPVWDTPDVVRAHNPVVRVPTLVLDDGDALVESYAILDWLDEQAGAEKRLTPAVGAERRKVMKTTAIALGAIDKAIWAAYELRFHPKEKQHQPWIDHNDGQVLGGLKYLDALAAKAGNGFLCGPKLTQADITATIACSFGSTARPKLGIKEACPALAKLAERCEAMPAFTACKP
jgi:glutathione S-transferase